MATIGDLVIDLKADTGQFNSSLNKSRGVVSGFVGSTVNAFAKIGLAADGLRVAFSAISEPLELAKTQALNERKLEQVFKTTGGAAGFAADEIKRFAAERQNLTSFGDEETINAAAILGSFTNVRGRVFKDALVSAQDLSSFLGNDLQSSIIMIGKALNDPARGLTALSKAGIQFTDSQKESIKTLQQTGKIADAQKIILKELQTQFGGQAEALVDPIQQMKNAWGDAMEQMGFAVREQLLPVMPTLIDWIVKLGDKLSGVVSKANEFTKAMDRTHGRLGAWMLGVDHEKFMKLREELQGWTDDMNALKKTMRELLIPNMEDSLDRNREAVKTILDDINKSREAFNKPGADVEEPRIDMSGVAPNIGDKTMNDLRRATAQWKPNEHAAGQFIAGMIREGLDMLQSGVMSLGPINEKEPLFEEDSPQLRSLEKGSQETSDVLQANFGAGKDKVPEKQLAEAQKHTKMLEEIKKNLMAKAQSVFEVKGLN